MGLFDKLLKSGLKAVGEAVADVVTDTLKENFGDANTNQATTSTTTYQKADNRNFAQKLSAVLENLGGYEIRNNVSPSELEQEAGRAIYTRGGCYAEPDNLTYALYKNGERVLFINLWEFYEDYKRTANREIRKYCDNNGIKVLDFFDYLPNEIGYMEDRIRNVLV